MYTQTHTSNTWLPNPIMVIIYYTEKSYSSVKFAILHFNIYWRYYKSKANNQ